MLGLVFPGEAENGKDDLIHPPFSMYTDWSLNTKEGQTNSPLVSSIFVTASHLCANDHAKMCQNSFQPFHPDWANSAQFIGGKIYRYNFYNFIRTLKCKRSGRKNILADETSFAVRIIEC